MLATSLGVARLGVLLAIEPAAHRMDMPLPPRPPLDYGPVGATDLAAPPRPHALGTNTTVFVNFDGVDLGECNPSNSQRDCSWYNFEDPFEPFSGSAQTKVSILQAMRSDVSEFGIRVTGQRPEDGDYTMVIYGGTEEQYGALGSAPAGDCDDELPNQIAFAHLDGDLAGWVNGGSTTALHEAAHSWGLDHIDFEGSIMFPSGNNGPTYYRDECDGMVEDTELTPGQASCPELNTRHCGDSNRQNAAARLDRLFGAPYVDTFAPQLELVEPEDGQYFQAPATFGVVFDTIDDQHPQAYSVYAWLNDDPRPTDPSVRVDPGFSVEELPIGMWDFHVVVVDEAGNESRVDFSVEVGEDPPEDPESDDGGCACTATRPSIPGWGLWIPLLLARRRKER